MMRKTKKRGEREKKNKLKKDDKKKLTYLWTRPVISETRTTLGNVG
jgi:hypothetical protein